MMLIGSRSQPRPPRPPSHRLSRTPVRDSGRCGRGSRGRLAGSGGDGQLRLAGCPAIPRGRGCGSRSGLGRADRGAGVPRPQPRAPPGRASSCRRAAGGSPVKCLAASSACRSRRVPQRDRLPPRSRGPRAAGAACRGGAGARSRGLTSLPGQLGGGVGAAARRLTCSGGGEASLGLLLCPCAPALKLGPRLQSAVRAPGTVATPASRLTLPRPSERRPPDSFLRCCGFDV